jgi:hypothetical protein
MEIFKLVNKTNVVVSLNSEKKVKMIGSFMAIGSKVGLKNNVYVYT